MCADAVAADRNCVLLFHAVADRREVLEDGQAIEALGMAVSYQPFSSAGDRESEPVNPSVLYLSSALDASERLILEHQLLKGRGRTHLLVTLDATPHPEAAMVTLPRDRLSRKAYYRQLLGELLEVLDRTGWNRKSETDLTRIVPSALVVVGAGKSSIIPPDFDGLVTIGRSTTCQISVASDFVSRLHGCIRCAGDHYLYRDMSTNGTVLIDGHEELLIHDDEQRLPVAGELRMGDVSLSFSVARP